MKLYHLSENNLDGKILYPRIPNNYMTKNGFEENKTPRVCFCTSIDGALVGLSSNLKNKIFYIHEPISYSSLKIKSNSSIINLVPDAKLTGETWVLESVKLKCIGKIKVIDAKDTPLKYKYGNNIGETYEWNYIKENSNYSQKGMSHMKMNMRDIRKRQTMINLESSSLKQSDVETSKKTTNVNIIESVLKNWKGLNQNNQFAFMEAMNIASLYMSNDKNNASDKNKVTRLLKEYVIPSVDNSALCESLISKFDKKYNLGGVLIEENAKNSNIDRILRNQHKLNKQFDIEGYIKENCYTDDEEVISACIEEMCSRIDSYKMHFDIKYTVALENILYSMDKQGIKVPKSLLVETVTNYFLSKDITNKQLDSMNYILSESSFYNVDDISNCSLSEAVLENNYILESKDNSKDIKQWLNDFKKQENKSSDGMKKVIEKIYTKSEDNIVEETPNILSWIRTFAVFSTLAINIPIGCLAIFIDQFIALKCKKDHTEKIVKQLKAEKNREEKKVDKLKNPKQKERTKEYIKELEKSIEKVEQYEDSLYSEKENDERMQAKYESSEVLYEETVKKAAAIVGVDQEIQDFVKDDDDFGDVIDSLGKYAKKDSEIVDKVLDDVVEFSLLVPYAIDHNRLLESLKEAKEEVYSEKVGNYHIKASNIQNNIYKLEGFLKNKKNAKVIEEGTIFDICNNLHDVNEVKKSIKECVSYMQETSMKSQAKMAQNKLKNTVRKLSDKDKAMSNKLDYTVDSFNKKVQNGLTNKNREAVIKGSILPSASNALKLCMAAGAVAKFASPAIAIIGTIAGIAISKGATARERQFILDEIEIQQDVVKKKIELAESNNDMKSLEELLKIQKKLKREEQRIKYHMKNYYPMDAKD